MTASSTIQQPLLRIDKLKLNNFRCFAECEVDFHPALTVLVAENAQGKTAILDAVGIALDVFVSSAVGRPNSDGFHLNSIHLVRSEGLAMEPALPTEFHAEGFIESMSVKWSRSLNKSSPKARTTTKDTNEVIAATELMKSRAANHGSTDNDSSALLPVVAFYRTDRLWGGQKDLKRKVSIHSPDQGRLSGYLDWTAPSSSFSSFVSWYGSAFSELRSSKSKFRGENDRLEKQLSAIHEAVRAALEPTGWISLDWEYPSISNDSRPEGGGFVVVEHPTRGRFPLSLLSDGVKNMVALVADLAYRCIRLNPHLSEDAARLTPGIVLIDEVDMHLHPSWQQVVIEQLQKAFPAVQMILTTHSPQVLSTVSADSIRLVRLDNSKATVRKPKYQTRGVESADILARLMDVDPVPRVEEACWLSDYRVMIQTQKHDSKEGLDLWSKIVAHFGSEHPVLSEIETLRRLQEFKRANKISEEAASKNEKN